MAKSKIIDLGMVERLAYIQCTKTEMCAVLGVDGKTLNKYKGFSEAYKKGLEQGKSSLRRMQWKLAEKNTAMAIWLGKQYLGQTDRQEVANTFNSEQPTSLEFKITNQEDKGRLEKLESEICGKNSDS